MSKRYRADKRTGVVVETEGDMTPKGMEMMMDGKFPLRGGAVGIGTQEHYQDGTSNTTGTMATLPNSNSTTVYMDGAKDLDESRKEVRKDKHSHLNINIYTSVLTHTVINSRKFTLVHMFLILTN